MIKTDLRTTLAVCFAVAAAACDHEDLGEAADALEAAPVPASGVPAAPRDGVWVSRWDNPPMTGSHRLRELETSEANNLAWAYGKFDLYMHALDVDAGEEYDLFAEPPQGLFEPDDVIAWTSRGVRLPRRITMAQNEGIVKVFAKHDDWKQTPAVDDTETARVQLDPNVLIIPIHLIQLHRKAGSSTSENGWFSEDHAGVAFDDDTFVYTHLSNADPFYPNEVRQDWAFQPGDSPFDFKQPDQVWTACDVQFRLVAYSACEVPDDVFNNQWTPQSGAHCNSLQQEAMVRTAASNCQSAQGKPGFKVILTGTLENAAVQCAVETAGVTREFQETIMTKKGLTSSCTLAHELGHAMGIKQHLSDPNDVMHDTAISGSPCTVNTNAVCSVGRMGAAILQTNQWPSP